MSVATPPAHGEMMVGVDVTLLERILDAGSALTLALIGPDPRRRTVVFPNGIPTKAGASSSSDPVTFAGPMVAAREWRLENEGEVIREGTHWFPDLGSNDTLSVIVTVVGRG